MEQYTVVVKSSPFPIDNEDLLRPNLRLCSTPSTKARTVEQMLLNSNPDINDVRLIATFCWEPVLSH